MERIFKAILSLILAISLLVAPAPASVALEAACSDRITPAEYKLSKSISDSFCEAIADGLTVKEALDYGISQSTWAALEFIVAFVFTPDNIEGQESPSLSEHTNELIEKKASKCLTKTQTLDLHAYLQELDAQD